MLRYELCQDAAISKRLYENHHPLHVVLAASDLKITVDRRFMTSSGPADQQRVRFLLRFSRAFLLLEFFLAGDSSEVILVLPNNTFYPDA
jgi:hypothetical protein